MKTFLNFRFISLAFLICLLLLGTISKTIAQNLSIFPNQGARGNTFLVTISSPGIYFQQGSPTVCPNKLSVSTSNIVFQQGSTTINPYSITTNNGAIVAELYIPNNANIGYCDVIVGQGEGCPAYLNSGFYISDSYLYNSPNFGSGGTNLAVTISGIGVDFHQGSPTVCPSHFNVTPSTVYFKQGSSTIYPSSVSVNNGQIVAQVSIPSIANGYYDVVVSDANCSITNHLGFTVQQQSLTVNPGSTYIGQTLNVSIVGEGINFVQGSSTVCPTQLNVTTSNVYFQQGSSTIYPSSISINNNIITAQLSVPMDATTGWYTLIVGNGEECSFSKNYALAISSPSIYNNLTYGITGRQLEVTIAGSDLNFTQSSSTLCPTLLNVTTSNVVFQQGSYTIYPSNISLYNNNSDIIATLDIPSDAPTGYYNAIVGYNEECSYQYNNSLNIQNPSIDISPSTGAINQQLSVTIIGMGINFHQGSATVCPYDFNVITNSDVVFRLDSVDIHPISVSGAGSTIIADLNIPPNAPIGNYELIIGENSSCPYSMPNAFTVTLPYITAEARYNGNGNSVGILIRNYGVNLEQDSTTNCPFTLNVNTSNIYITDGTTTIHPDSIQYSKFYIISFFTFSNNQDIYEINQYKLVVGDQSGCPDTTNITLELPMGVSTSQISIESAIKIYPNPSDGNQLNLEIMKEGSYEVIILNQYGQSIGTTTVNGPGTIQLPEILREKLSPGMYLINVNDGRSIQHEKFIIE